MKTIKIAKLCPCGNTFLLTPGQVREKHGKYCSRWCYFKYRTVFNVSKISHLLKGKLHWNYKGNSAKYSAFHLRVQQIRGKATICKNCGSKHFVEWANLTGKYEDVYDYKEFCRKCHHKYDNIADKGWTTRRKKTSLEAGIALQHTEGGDAL